MNQQIYCPRRPAIGMRWCAVLTAFLMVTLTIIFGCSKSPTKSPSPPPGQGSLLVDRLVVSMVPGGSETVAVYAKDGNGNPETFSIINSDPDIASATAGDTAIYVTGLSFGTTTISVASASGQTSTLPVQVYDPFYLDTGELLITYVDSFTFIWQDWGGGADCSFHRPVEKGGFHALGSLGVPNHSNPNGNYAMMLVKAKQGSDALALPTGYERVWYAYPMLQIGSVWKPIPPSGYVALGTVVVATLDEPPPLDRVVCVREDLTIDGEAGSYIWHDAGTGMPMDLGCWRIDQPTAGPHEYCYLTTGTFVGWNYYNPPESHDVMHVLKLNLPMLAEAPYQTFVPTLTGYESPPEETVPMMGKAMLVPCTIVNDQIYSGDIDWQVANSPFYRLERHVYYKLLYHNHNQTSEVQTNSVTIRSGITTSESERIWNETEISVSVEAGLSIKAFSGKVTATVSRRFGYETETSVAELQETEIQSSINTPPGKSAALWQQYNRYVLKRHNGTGFEDVSSWEFGIDSYVTDEYPD